MQDKKMRDEMIANGFREAQGVSPQVLGNGYGNQLKYMEEAERMNNIAIQHYQNNVGAINSQKAALQNMREKNAEEEGLARMNAAAYNVADYKQRLMDEHHTLLKNQMDG